MGGRVRGVSLACALTSRHPKPFPISFATQTGARRFRTPSKGEGGGRHRWASRHVGDIPLLQATALRTAHPVPCVLVNEQRECDSSSSSWRGGTLDGRFDFVYVFFFACSPFPPFPRPQRLPHTRERAGAALSAAGHVAWLAPAARARGARRRTSSRAASRCCQQRLSARRALARTLRRPRRAMPP